MRIKAFRAVSVILTLIWMCVIFSFSAQNSEKSSNTSAGVIEKVVSVVYPGFKDMTDTEKTEKVESLQFTARKTAHCLIYTVLGVLSFLSVISYRKLRFYIRPAISALICLLYALSDEVHQLFVAGRSCEFRDVFIDFCGALLGIAICTAITRCTKIYHFVRAGSK